MILESQTVESLEFDGNTVLCRVCGDKASGFHYGVHACEGCKGFFRRSIQQKIQYRPCLKNQQCNIMRVNRNRCQYCRLKKCISVGMSRDAVRFGRVPKKEKAKIMEQMKRVNALSQLNAMDNSLDSDPDFLTKIVKAHFQNCDFTKDKLRGLCERAWSNPKYINCPAHMACPLNPKPDAGDKDSSDNWAEFTEFFTPAIRNVVNFAKNLPGFQLFSQDDQVTLLKAGTFEVLLVHLAPLFDAKHNTMMFANGKLYKKDSLSLTSNAGFLLDSMFDFAGRINVTNLNDEEIALFSAAVIIAADRPGLRNVEIVEKVQKKIHKGLQTMLGINHADDNSLFHKLLLKIPDLRTLNTLHSEKLLGTAVPQNPLIKQEKMDEDNEAMDKNKSHDQARDVKLANGGCPYSSNPAMFGMPGFNGMLPFAPHFPTGAPPQFPQFPDFRRDMLQAAYSMYGRLPTPALNTPWPIKYDHKDIPFWAQLAANQSLMSDTMVSKEISNDADVYGERRGSNASSIRSQSSYVRDDEPMIHKKTSAPHTISKSPSLDNKCDTTLSLDNSNDAHKAISQSYGRDSSPEPLELDVDTSKYSNHVVNRNDARRKRTFPADRPDLDAKIPRIHQLWEYDMRTSRSNSMSSSSSLESADSAYRTISNPGTPRSNVAESRSPYPQCTTMNRSFTESRSPRPDMKSYSPYRNSPLLARDSTNVSPSPLALDKHSSSPYAMDKHTRSHDDKCDDITASKSTKESSRGSPVLKTALSLPPLLGQEAWFHTPKRNGMISDYTKDALQRTISMDTTASEVIDVESLETDVMSPNVVDVNPSQKMFKVKKSFLERFSPEPIQSQQVALSSVDRFKQRTSSPAGSLPERPTVPDCKVPERSKTASPQSRSETYSTTDGRLDNTDAISPPQLHQSSTESLSRVQAMASLPVHMMASQLGSQPMIGMPGFASPALMYQYAAMQQLHNMQAMQRSINRASESKGSALDLVIKKEPHQ